jgi:hypothetical protein
LVFNLLSGPPLEAAAAADAVGDVHAMHSVDILLTMGYLLGGVSTGEGNGGSRGGGGKGGCDGGPRVLSLAKE